MKQRNQQKLDNPANVDQKVAQRITNGNKLIENLKAQANPPSYADSILKAAKFNKMRVLEAHISNYSDSEFIREKKINESDPKTGRNALHFLSYLGHTEMI